MKNSITFPTQLATSTSIITTLTTLLLLTQPHLSHSVRCHPEDKKVLLQIKESFNNPYHLSSWDPDTDCCYWYVVRCDRRTNRIDQFALAQANVSGRIPEQIGDLPYLVDLVFHHVANLTGPIPSSITKLRRLQRLTISYTNISGPIPSFLGELENLTFLDLSFNGLPGPVPPSLAWLRNLGGLRLDRNRLTGPIPDSFGDLPPGLNLYMSHNLLSGRVPERWAELDFAYLELQRNRLEGDALFLLGPNKNSLQGADLSRNMFEFDFSNVAVPDQINNLDLSHNRIYGRLPDGLVVSRNLFLNVSYNRLCGPIPVGGRLQEFDSTVYFHNKCLCGAPLPPCK